jgi:ABC-2 type transport system permease protein
MSFLWLAFKDLLLVARDKKALLTLIGMPLLLIAILGAAFGSMMKEGKDVALPKFTLGVVNQDNGQLSKALIDGVFKKELSKEIKIKTYQEDELRKKIKSHALAVGIIIEPDFSDSLVKGESTKVKLLTVPDPGIKATIVEKVIEQFGDSVPIMAISTTAGQSAQGSAANDYKHLVNETTVSAKTKIVGSFQYYAAAMGVMFLLMTVVQGVSNMILEKEQVVYNRLQLTSLSYKNYLFGKMLGLIVICLLQAFLLILGTHFIYGVNWGDSVPGIIAITITFVINACGLGVLAGSLMRTEKSFAVAGMFGSQILAALGGSMAPLYIFPDWIIFLTKFLPNGLALQTYLKLMTGAAITDIIPAVLGSAGLGALFFAIGLVRLSSERRRRYA